MTEETDDGTVLGSDDGELETGENGAVGWPASRSCAIVRYLGAGLLLASTISLAVTIFPVSLTVDLPWVEVVGYPSLRSVTRGIIVGLVLLGNGELAGQIVNVGKVLKTRNERGPS